MLLGRIQAERTGAFAVARVLKHSVRYLEGRLIWNTSCAQEQGGAQRGGVERLDHDGCFLVLSRATQIQV